MKRPKDTKSTWRKGKITVMEILVGVAVVVVLGAIVFTFMKSAKAKRSLAAASQKMKALGDAFTQYHTDNGGLLPLEDAPGKDDWDGVIKEEAVEAWYNALPRIMGAAATADLVDTPETFYQTNYPLFIPGAGYPKTDKKLSRPYFAIGMNSRLQRKSEDGTKTQGTYASILKPANTVIFLERGLPNDQKVSKLQGKFDGSPKANAKDFASRHNQRGIILFADGHTEYKTLSELIDKTGRIVTPQELIIWTPDPDQDPN